MTEHRNGKDIDSEHVKRLPAPALTYDERVLALLWLKATIDQDAELKSVVHVLNEDRVSVPLHIVDGIVQYAIRCCPFLRSDATRQAIEAERATVRQNWLLSDQLDN